MKNKIKIPLLAFFIICTLGFSNEYKAKTNIDGATKIWDDFVSALRTGDMPEAYSKLSKESKMILSYRDFCVEWHPIGIKYNTVLSNPGYSNFSIFGDLATIKIGADPSLNNSKNDFIRIILEKKDNIWSVVSEKVHDQAILRAAITGVLKDIIKESKTLNTAFTSGKGSFEEIVKELPRIFTSDRGKLALANYTFELDLLRDGVLRAIPKKENTLGYQISQDGILSSFNSRLKDFITAEELQARRKNLKKQKEYAIIKKQKDLTLLTNHTHSKSNNTVNKKKQINKPQLKRNNLPDLPPDFPMDFTDKKAITQKETKNKKLKYLNGKEDFDLPEIDNITEIFDNPKSNKVVDRNSTKLLNKNNTQTMAGTNNAVYSNSVDLNSEELLEELELMVNEYEEKDNIAILGDNND